MTAEPSHPLKQEYRQDEEKRKRFIRGRGSYSCIGFWEFTCVTKPGSLKDSLRSCDTRTKRLQPRIGEDLLRNSDRSKGTRGRGAGTRAKQLKELWMSPLLLTLTPDRSEPHTFTTAHTKKMRSRKLHRGHPGGHHNTREESRDPTPLAVDRRER